MKNLLYGLFLLVFSSGFADIHYSNMIIFGDSQSDIGNMPESGLVEAQNNAPPYYHGILYNLYIPASNPVVSIHDPYLSRLLSFAQLPEQPLINKQYARQGRSINWSQYLFIALKNSNQLESHSFLPWASVYQNAKWQTPMASIDYAFAGALSNAHCADDHYQGLDDHFCNEAQVLERMMQYRANPYNNDLRLQVIIPGVQRQINFFAQDLQAHRVYADQNSLYVVWTGANDLGVNFKNLLAGQIQLFNQNLTQSIPQQTMDAIIQLHQLGARHIVIVGQQNLGLTPEASYLTGIHRYFYQRYLNAYALNFLVLRYNLALAQDLVNLQKRYPDLDLRYLDLQSFFNHLSFTPGKMFFKNLGLACQNQDTATYAAIAQGKLVDCPNYLYWNSAHFTDEANWLLSQIMFKQIHH